jgi:hypothetical protein
MPKMLDLFAGTRSVSREFEKAGWETYSVEWDKKFKDISLYADISKLTAQDIIKLCGGRPDVIWASPDCTSYSVSAISHHRQKVGDTLRPISEYAMFCDRTNNHVLDLIAQLKPKYFFIENPRAGMRKMNFMRAREQSGFMKRYTVTYCQYGDFRMKPTDIWTNHPNPQFKPPCNYGDSCHEHAPRGSVAGSQRLKNAKERARIPEQLCKHIVRICSR